MSENHLENFFSHYWKVYGTILNNLRECPTAYDIGDEAFQKVLEVLPKRKSLRIIGIGSGQGQVDCLMIGRMLTRVSRIDNTIVEPCKDAIEVFKSRISREFSNKVSTTWYQETFQEYQKRRERSGATDKFDFVGVVQSLYYAAKDARGIGNLIDLLEDDGVLFIAVQSDDSGLINIYRKCAEMSGPGHKNVSRDYVTSEVLKLLDDDGRVTYEIVKKTNHTIDVTACFEPELRPEGLLILDFISHIVDFKSTVSKDFIKSLLDHLKSPDCSNVLPDGRVFLREDLDAIMIRKK
ncbi:Histamine N-methyltransferase [Holothuria leucospilota]|uniref:Histamine N-methyltransferase n=1 Tax=Holothuria leucospilota TaxID=206669 RepID=A0A9Q1HBQ8_HOLLE|nr:Histamine N-methyltransferase [Holothuria leucospilota]